MKSKFSIVFVKEFVEHLRDRRSLMMLSLFVLMYPLMMGYMLHHMIERATKPEREGMEVSVINGAQAPTLMTQLQQKNITLTHLPPTTDEGITKLLRDHKAVAVLRLEDKYAENYNDMRPAKIELWYDSASDDGPRQLTSRTCCKTTVPASCDSACWRTGSHAPRWRRSSCSATIPAAMPRARPPSSAPSSASCSCFTSCAACRPRSTPPCA
ncbi:hypothetical protein LP419_13150 [Massilia sp. H-1]|nr:hypothetical protein LP419_13150 [Massilia sp. H-1]